MARADRFTVFGGVVAALHAVVRRPVGLSLALAANVVLTAVLAWADKAVLEPLLLGRVFVQLAYLAIDVTCGLWVLLLVASAFEPKSLSIRETGVRLGWALAPAVVVNLIDGAPTILVGVLLGEPQGYRPWYLPMFSILLVAHLILAIWIGCTLAFASFVATARPMRLSTALEESLALTARSRWRLGFFAFWLTVGGLVVSILTPTARTPVEAAVSQAVYTCYYVAGLILSGGMGLALTSASLGRHRGLAAEFD